jgi:dTDP-4-amino-4,6-dideoxygalactose transaminase
MALVALKYLDNDNSYRRQLAKWYREELSECDNVKIVPIAQGCESSTHLLQIRVSNRDELLIKLNENDIYPGVHYTDNSEYKMYEKSGRCPKALIASNEIISLPMHMGITRHDVVNVVSMVKKYSK